MKNFIKTLLILFLLLVIASSGIFILFKTSAQKDNPNFFNNNLRSKFSHSSSWRNVLGLHFDGDGRFDYLKKENKEIVIRVISMKGLYIDKEVLSELSQKIEAATGKKTSFMLADDTLDFVDSVDPKTLIPLVDSKKYAGTSNQVFLYLIIASHSNQDQDQIGSTLGEDGIIFFKNTLLEFIAIQDDFQKVLDEYTTSTLLHEFGHQLGLNHNDQPGCLMNPTAEIAQMPGTNHIINDFCQFEKEQIENFKD